MARPELPAGGAVLSDDDPARSVARGRLGWIFAAIWLVYLVPVLQEAAGRPSTAERVVGVAAVVAFGAGYVWSFVTLRRWRLRGRPLPLGWRVRVLGLSVALFAVAAVAVGEQSLAMLVFVAVQSVFVLPAARRSDRRRSRASWSREALVHLPGWSSMEGIGFSVALASIAMWGVPACSSGTSSWRRRSGRSPSWR